MVKKRRVLRVVSGIMAGLTACLLVGGSAQAQQGADRPFSLQVTPSPLVVSVKPGEARTLDLRVRNAGPFQEDLRTELRQFKVGAKGDVELLNEMPQEVKEWVKFSSPRFSVKPGEWFTQQIKLNPPKESGFSYSFAIVISRAQQPTQITGSTKLQGSIAVFTLISIDRPGAVRQFSIEKAVTTKNIYEFLPTDFSVRLKNTGNTIVLPVGNIFIQRSSSSKSPVAVLPLNAGGAYMLPGMDRTFNESWTEGFPAYVSQKVADNVPPERKLVWDWSRVQQFRFGRYVAKIVAVYNDGQRDVPVYAEISFWVFPWKVMLVALLIAAILLTGIIVIIRRFIRLGSRARKTLSKHTPSTDAQ